MKKPVLKHKIALQFLEGLKQDIEESKGGVIEIEDADIEQIDNCIQLIEKEK